MYQLSNRGNTCPANISTMNHAAGQNWANSQGRSQTSPFHSLDTQSMATALQLASQVVSPTVQGAGGACGAVAQEGSENPAQGDTDSSSTQGLLSLTCSWAKGGDM